jgi:prolyl oligopeptidase
MSTGATMFTNRVILKSLFTATLIPSTLLMTPTTALAQNAGKPIDPAVQRAAPAAASAASGWTYPAARRENVVDTYHGVQVADPYRWLEEPDSTETRAWIDAQNAITNAYIAGVPQRQAIEDRITKLWNFEKFGTPFKEGGRYFWSYNSGLQNQGVIMVADSLDQPGRVLLDPNTLKADGTMALAGLAISDDGKHMAYGIAEAGSDWNTWRVRDIATGQDTGDELKWVKFSGASFTKDGKGLFYSRFDEPTEGTKLTGSNFYQKLYYHALGTPQSQDILVYHEPTEEKKDWGFGGGVTEDGKYLIVSVWQGTDPRNRIYFKELNPAGIDASTLGNQQVVKLLDQRDAEYDFITNVGSVFYFKTDLDAPLGRVVAIDVKNPARENWREIIPQATETLQSVSSVGGALFANYLKDASTLIKQYDKTGAFVRDVALPGIGSAGGFGGKDTDTETFYSFTGFTVPSRIYRYDIASGKSTLFKQAQVDFNPDDYQTEQVFFTSKDGTKVPMFIISKKGIKRDGTNPTLLYAYGGFNASITPSFSVSNLVWMEMGGVYAVANIRGGGEYGKKWHDAARGVNRPRAFEDFIAAGEFLIDQKITSPQKLAIRGGSNGGLLVGAVMTQRPDLFGAALPEVGVLDMLRFEDFTIGHAWTSDYGTKKNEAEFKALLSYSPYHNVKDGTCYPATMIMTADHDDRVVPAHSFKFAAALQHGVGKQCPNPALIRVETRAGHGAGKPTAKIIEEAADRWAFLVRALGMNPAMNSESPTGTQPAGAMAQPAQGMKVVLAGREARIKVSGMTCAMCEGEVQAALKALPGVEAVKANHETGEVVLTFEPGQRFDANGAAEALASGKFKIE